MNSFALMLTIIPTASIFIVGIWLYSKLNRSNNDRLQLEALLKQQQQEQQLQRERFDEHQIKSLKLIQDSMQNALLEVRNQVNTALKQHGDNLGKSIDKLTIETQKRLKDISQEVDKQLNAGFEKTNATFINVIKRLTIIDEAQKKISELSGNVISLNEVLSDKKSRGAFGEVQLNNLITNMIPPSHFEFQYTLSNGKRCDCMLFLPEPTGNVAIDSKFPLEDYRIMNDKNADTEQKKLARQQFKIMIRKHVTDIATKYIIPNETSDGAMMFIPAESIFAEIHAHYPELVDFAQRKHVWLVSPTTMMAILTTAKAVLKDAATRKQVHIIQEHLVALGKDFSRFQKRMDNLAKHIDQAHQDVDSVHKSSQKITSRFNKIESVELQTVEMETLDEPT